VYQAANVKLVPDIRQSDARPRWSYIERRPRPNTAPALELRWAILRSKRFGVMVLGDHGVQGWVLTCTLRYGPRGAVSKLCICMGIVDLLFSTPQRPIVPRQ
jgi:hypothetical protein